MLKLVSVRFDERKNILLSSILFLSRNICFSFIVIRSIHRTNQIVDKIYVGYRAHVLAIFQDTQMYKPKCQREICQFYKR